MSPTKDGLARRANDLGAAGPEAAGGPDLAELAVDRRDAAPSERPEGMTFDPEADPPLLAYDFWEAQRDCLDRLEDSETDVVAFLAGYGAGKSIVGARWLLMTALRHPGSRFLAMGQSFSEARHSTFQVLFNALPGDRTHLVTSAYNGPESSPLVRDYNRAEHRLTLANDSVIILGSADKWNRHAGEEFGGLWLDEPSHYGEDLHDLLEMLGGRLRGVAGPKVMCWTLTGNGYGPAWEILEKRESATGDPIGLHIDVVRASALDNPYLHDSDKDRLRRQFAGTGREEQALYGGFAAAQGLVYSQFSRETHVRPHSEASALVGDEWRAFGYDAGWNDPRVLLELGRTAYNQLVVLDEFYRSETHVDAAIGWLDETDKPTGTIYCEHVPGEIEQFRAAGWDAEKADKDLDSGIAEVRSRLESERSDARDRPGKRRRRDGSAGKGTPALPSRLEQGYQAACGSPSSNADGERADPSREQSGGSASDASPTPGLLISDRCENLIRELLSYQEEHVGKSAAEDHCCDALRYAVHTEARGDSDSGGPTVPIRSYRYPRKSSSPARMPHF